MSTTRILKVPVIFNVGAPTRDRGLRFRGETQELTDEQKLTMIGFDGTFGLLVYGTDYIPESEMPKDIPLETGRKTPSQRLRNVLYVQWQQSGDTSITADEYYQRRMEQIINQQKELLS